MTSTVATKVAVEQPGSAPRRTRPRWHVAALFTATSFFGASLLFTVQPLVARLLLPSYGGSATVWSTSSLFFQVLLLAGYLYSHLTTRAMGRRRQPWIHLAVLALPVLALPLALPDSAAPDGQYPALWLLRTLMLMIGLPFVVLATTGPLLQRWYSWSDGPRAHDPYFMFAAGNLGSFTGLLAYPFVLEPRLSLTDQRLAFSAAFAVFAVMTAACALIAVRGRAPEAGVAPEVTTPPPAAPTKRTAATWVALAFLPSCLMLAVTAHLATDVASIPLLWVAPLALYLATFVAAFARTSRTLHAGWPRAAAALGACAAAATLMSGSLSIWVALLLNLTLLTFVGYVAHSRLAISRPAPAHLTTFYLLVATGGALGGLVNGLMAPMLFDRVLEYPLTLAAVPLLLIGLGTRKPSALERRYGRVAITAATAVAMTAAFLVVPAVLGRRHGLLTIAATLVLLAVAGWVVARRPLALTAATLLAMLVVASVAPGEVLTRGRTFYGSYLVSTDGEARYFRHGTTLHGLQFNATPTEPTTYYARSGPLGSVIESVGPSRLGIVGLGTGTIAAYGGAGDRLTFYEIDQAVADVASDPAMFSYLADSPAEIDVQVGDGRLLLAEEPESTFDLIVLDAFSSDAIPVHLLTREAFDLYATRTRPGGAVAVHISNRMFDLAPVIAAAATHLGWHVLLDTGGAGRGATPSTWAVLTQDDELVTSLSDEGWHGLDDLDPVTWTDDYSSVLDVLK